MACGCVHDSEHQQLLETDTYPTSTFLIPVQLADHGIDSPNAGALGNLSDASIELLIAFRPVG